MNKFVLMSLCAFLFSSCCTLTHKSYQEVDFVSYPSGANISIDGYSYGVTPMTIKLELKHPYQVLLEKEGFEPQCYALKSKVGIIKLSSNLLFPVGGMALGAGVGLIAGASAGPWGLILVIAGAYYGLGAGTGVGLIGTGVDLSSGRAKQLYPATIKAHLQQVHKN